MAPLLTNSDLDGSPDASTAANGHGNHNAVQTDNISDLPMRTRRRLKILVVGAGFSGLSMAHAVESGQIANCDIAIYEKNSSIGGTWFENRYPGCACDIPAHNYQFSWAPYPHFPNYYAKSADIHRYMEEIVKQCNLRHYIHLSHKVIDAQWDQSQSKWLVTLVKTDGRELVVSDGKTKEGELGTPFQVECDILVNASGAYNNWRWPSIRNLDEFQGQLLHSAAWPRNVSLAGQTVALIGNGSSGIQILPAILDQVEKVYTFIRSPTWITSGFASKYAGSDGANIEYSESQKRAWSEDPESYLRYRKAIENELNKRFGLYIDHTTAQGEARSYAEQQMRQRLKAAPELASKLIPSFPVGCRRTTPGIAYLEALCSPKVEVIWGEIDSLTAEGVKSAATSEVKKVDTVICATGFDMGFAPRFPVKGVNGVNLQQEWRASDPACYLSLAAENMPNYFVFLGPGSPLGHGSIVGAIERVTEYIAKMTYKLQTENYSSVMLRPGIARAWQAQTFKWTRRSVWTAHCRSTYKNGTEDGNVIALHPGSRLHYFDLLQSPRYEDFEWKSRSDRAEELFAWLGNGFTAAEADGSIDLSYYLQLAEPLKESGSSSPPKSC